MSDQLFFTRLRWSNGTGVAKLHGRSVELKLRPEIEGLEIEELVYTPEVKVAIVREVGRPSRELRPEEIAACDAFLRSVCAPWSNSRP